MLEGAGLIKHKAGAKEFLQLVGKAGVKPSAKAGS